MKNGIDYHFVSINFMEEKSFFSEESFTVASGDTWYYGISSEDLYRSLFTDKKNNYIIIMTPTEYKKLNKMLFAIKGIDYISAQIDISDDIRKERLIKRGDDIEEIERRIKADNKDFESLKLKYRKEEFFPLFYIHDKLMQFYNYHRYAKVFPDNFHNHSNFLFHIYPKIFF